MSSNYQKQIEEIAKSIDPLRNLSLVKLLEEYLSGASIRVLSRKYRVHPDAIKRRLSPILKILQEFTGEQLAAFRDKKSDLLDAVQLKLLIEIADENKVKRANLRDLAMAFEKIHTATRLERDQSTANIAMKQETFVSMLQELTKDKDIEPI